MEQTVLALHGQGADVPLRYIVVYGVPAILPVSEKLPPVVVKIVERFPHHFTKMGIRIIEQPAQLRAHPDHDICGLAVIPSSSDFIRTQALPAVFIFKPVQLTYDRSSSGQISSA